MDVSVTAASPPDAAELAAVAATTFPLACPPSTTPESIAAYVAENLSAARFADQLDDPGRLLLKATVGEAGRERIVGYAMLVAGEPHGPEVSAQLRIRPTVELRRIYVLPEHHGGDVAGELMRAVLSLAAGFGEASGIWLGTNQQNARAQRFYVKHGFERVGVKRFLLGGRYEDDYVYERALEARPA